MKFLELCLSPDLGGLELYVERCCRMLSETDELHGVLNAQGRLAGRLRDAGHTTSFLGTGYKPLPWIRARKLAGIIDGNGIALVHVHWGNDLPLASLAKRLSKVQPALVYTRQMQITQSKKDAYHRVVYEQMDLMLTITRNLERSARDYLPDGASERVRTLYYGVREPQKPADESERDKIRNEAGIPHVAFLCGLFGRLQHEKGQHLLIEAIARARDQGDEIHALIVGHEMENGYHQTLREMAMRHGIPDCIHFLDFVENPQRYMQACDCVVLATREETFGLVLAEAMRAGVAVIGSDRGGVPEIIENEKSGLMFESMDAADLGKQLSRLKNAPGLRQRLAADGKDRADRLFDQEAHFRSLREIFEEVEARRREDHNRVKQ